ncbi:hypothetical protein [Streptomyces sp. SGAir0957]
MRSGPLKVVVTSPAVKSQTSVANFSLVPDGIARTAAYAIEQSSNVDIVIRPTA